VKVQGAGLAGLATIRKDSRQVFLSDSLQKMRKTYHEYPLQFWFLLLGSFVDSIGGALVFPFFTLYVSRRFGVNMTSLGLLIGVFAITNLLGGILGGALADRVGRKATMLMGLTVSGLSSLLMGWASSLRLLSLTILVVGLFAEAGGPARQAMVADLLPERQRAQGFGLLRVVHNLAVVIGPAIGGLLAASSFLWLFVGDAVASLLTAILVAAVLRETRPQSDDGADQGNLLQTMRGYGIVLRDGRFMAFMLMSMLVMMVSLQMNTSLPVYLSDAHGVSAQGFGYLLTLNASMVVLLQFWVTRRIRPHPPLLVAALGGALYGAGYALYGVVTAYGLFMAAMAIVTMGEMVIFPTIQALAAQLAPMDMRGRYLAAFGFSWAIPAMLGPTLVGWIMDNTDARWAWYVAGVIGGLAAVGFIALHKRMGHLLPAAPQPGEEAPSGSG
jgi:MFS family permease